MEKEKLKISVTYSNGESVEYILNASLVVLNDALRDKGILRVLRVRDEVIIPAYINFSQVSSVELLDYAGKSWEDLNAKRTTA
ncbi:MAG TPA: hypothetical protein VN611_11035 [Patescibacteria group bacterium]|nr:hypothetical protein [Patescibacteria group bacterium]